MVVQVAMRNGLIGHLIAFYVHNRWAAAGDAPKMAFSCFGREVQVKLKAIQVEALLASSCLAEFHFRFKKATRNAPCQ